MENANLGTTAVSHMAGPSFENVKTFLWDIRLSNASALMKLPFVLMAADANMYIFNLTKRSSKGLAILIS